MNTETAPEADTPEGAESELSAGLGSTLNDHRSPATICKERGWKVGTRLVGDEGYGPTVIEITALGRNDLLAVTLSYDGKPPRSEGYESSWVLWCRDWLEVPNESGKGLATTDSDRGDRA